MSLKKKMEKSTSPKCVAPMTKVETISAQRFRIERGE